MDSIKTHQSDTSESSHDSCKLFIGGLSGKTTPDMLRQYFGKFGMISECTVMKDPITRRSRGFGFVSFVNPTSVESVLACENHEIDSKSVEAKLAVPKQSTSLIMSNQTKTSNHHSRKLFVGGLSAATTIEDIKRYFEQYGKVVDAMLLMDRLTQRHRGFAFVTFESEAVVERVIEVHFHEINNKMVECKKAKPKEELSPPPSRGFIRRGDMASYMLPGPAAGYYLHGLTGYAPSVLPAGALQTAFMPAGIDSLAAYTAALPSSMHALSFDSPLVGGATDGSASDVSPTPSSSLNAVNGLDHNGGGHGLYSQQGYVMTSGGLLVNQSLMSLVASPYGYVTNVPQPLSLAVGNTLNQRQYRNNFC